jgi:hypothetical protein
MSETKLPESRNPTKGGLGKIKGGLKSFQDALKDTFRGKVKTGQAPKQDSTQTLAGPSSAPSAVNKPSETKKPNPGVELKDPTPEQAPRQDDIQTFAASSSAPSGANKTPEAQKPDLGEDTKELSPELGGSSDQEADNPDAAQNPGPSEGKTEQPPPPISELWDEAYEELAKKKPDLVEEYQGKCLGGEAFMGERKGRHEKMRKFVTDKTEELDKHKWKGTFAGHEFAVKDLVKPVVGIIECQPTTSLRSCLPASQTADVLR